MTEDYKDDRWWHPGVLAGYAIAYTYLGSLFAGYFAVKLGRIAIGRD